MILNGYTLAEEASRTFANHHMTLFATAHLYNALHHMGLTNIYWDSMEHVIDAHVRPLFAGDIPTAPDTMYTRMGYRLGIRSSYRRFCTKQAFKFQSSPLGSILREYFSSPDLLATNAFYRLSEHVNIPYTSTPSPAQILSAIPAATTTLLNPMIHNVFHAPLTRICRLILSEIRTDLRDLMRDRHAYAHASAGKVGDSQDLSLTRMVLEILWDNKLVAEYMGRDGAGGFQAGGMLHCARDAFERVWRGLKEGEYPEFSDEALLDLGSEES